MTMSLEAKAISTITEWRQDWNKFASDALGVNLDKEQQQILSAIQNEPRVSVASGTSRGKDFVAAVAAVSFMYLTPRWNSKGELILNTKVALTAPTDRQIGNIMYPEITRLWNRAHRRGVDLPGRLVGYDIRTDSEEWFLTGFKADNYNLESWTGFHAVNTFFIVSEASGMMDQVFNAIEGNLQGNSRFLLVFNPNVSTGYAASSQRSTRWSRFRLDSLTAPNVINKTTEIPGQVDYPWIKDKVETWCTRISQDEYIEMEGDFEFEGEWYRPNDLFRVKVRGMFPRVGEDVLVPADWVMKANENWAKYKPDSFRNPSTAGMVQRGAETKHIPQLRLGVDVAGMGRDSTCFCHRYDNFVEKFKLIQSGGTANHMEVAGWIKQIIDQGTNKFQGLYPQTFIDTIGEGAGVYSRCLEQNIPRVYSVKAGAKPEFRGKELKDVNNIYRFENMRAYLAWAVRDWLDPSINPNACLPPDDDLFQELTEYKWIMRSDGVIKLEKKEDFKARIGRSPDKFDGLALTFYPQANVDPRPRSRTNLANMFH